MAIAEDYAAQGYAHAKALISGEVASAVLAQIIADLTREDGGLARYLTIAPIIRKTSIDVYARDYPPMQHFLWGLTPLMADFAGRPLLPTYNYFRLYRQGDVCRVHSDREACEHSLSLTLGYSDGIAWAFDIGAEPIEAPGAIESDFGEERYATLLMQPGDAVLYRGVTHRHGRLTPNPNAWSAHMFLHWVDRDGPYAACAFDGRPPGAALDIALP